MLNERKKRVQILQQEQKMEEIEERERKIKEILEQNNQLVREREKAQIQLLKQKENMLKKINLIQKQNKEILPETIQEIFPDDQSLLNDVIEMKKKQKEEEKRRKLDNYDNESVQINVNYPNNFNNTYITQARTERELENCNTKKVNGSKTEIDIRVEDNSESETQEKQNKNKKSTYLEEFNRRVRDKNKNANKITMKARDDYENSTSEAPTLTEGQNTDKTITTRKSHALSKNRNLIPITNQTNTIKEKERIKLIKKNKNKKINIRKKEDNSSSKKKIEFVRYNNAKISLPEISNYTNKTIRKNNNKKSNSKSKTKELKKETSKNSKTITLTNNNNNNINEQNKSKTITKEEEVNNNNASNYKKIDANNIEKKNDNNDNNDNDNDLNAILNNEEKKNVQKIFITQSPNKRSEESKKKIIENKIISDGNTEKELNSFTIEVDKEKEIENKVNEYKNELHNNFMKILEDGKIADDKRNEEIEKETDPEKKKKLQQENMQEKLLLAKKLKQAKEDMEIKISSYERQLKENAY